MHIFCDPDYSYQPLWKHYTGIEGKREEVCEIGLEVWMVMKNVPDLVSLHPFVVAMGWAQPHKDVSKRILAR